MALPFIHTEASFMLDIIKDVQKGDAVPASFQRPYVWGHQDIIDLWTSILKGYPIGTFLMWRPADPVNHGLSHLGPIQIEPKSNPKIILDGQNRLVTLAWSMTDVDKVPKGQYPGSDIFTGPDRLVADPHRKCVRFASPDEISGMVMPLHRLFNGLSAFYREAWSSDDDDAAMEWIETLGDSMRQARSVSVLLNRCTREEAKEAFLHISRAGVPMSEEDFSRAINA